MTASIDEKAIASYNHQTITAMSTNTSSLPKLYLGIDMHKKTWSIYPSTDLFEGKPFSMGADALQLIQWVTRYYPDHEVSCAYEACCCGFEPARIFMNEGWHIVIANPGDIPKPNKQNLQKTDLIDARNLSRQLKSGMLRPIAIPTPEQEQLRSLFRRRNDLVKQIRTIKSQIKGQLLYYNIHLPQEYDNNTWSKAMLLWLQELVWSFSTADLTLKSRLSHYAYLHKELLVISNHLRSYCRNHHKKDYTLLRSVPGIGPLTAIGFLAEIGDLRKFTSLKELASYIGLVPGILQSGESTIITGITPRSKALLRSYLIEASWQAVRYDPVMQQYYRSHVGKKPNKIIVKVAHKLVSRIRAVIRTEIPYQVGLEK
jgi:transposase